MKFSNPIPSWKEFPKGTPQFAVSQYFGENPAMYAQFGIIGHNGVDFAAPLDTPVVAVADGYIVEGVAKDTGFGLRISQRVGNYLLVYGHFHTINYSVSWNWNDQSHFVKAGTIIGYVDSTGFSTGNHLHFGLYQYDSTGNAINQNNGYGGAIDPWPFFVMSNTIFVHKTGTQEYGFYVPAMTEDALKDKAKNFGIDILKPDGSIDYSKAKDI